MKLLVIHGSPRKEGNSSFLAGQIVSCLPEAEVTEFHLYDLDYKGCTGCMACRKQSEVCVMRDEATPILTAMPLADVTVFATPVYQLGITGELKCLLDRFFSFLSTDHFAKRMAGVYPIPSRLGPGKTAVTVLTQGRKTNDHENVLRDLQSSLTNTGFEHHEALHALFLNSARDSRARPDLVEEARAIAERLKARHA